VWNWQRRGWKTAEGADVLNRDLWEQLLSLVNARGRNRIAWHWVRGHDGTPGNERVDEIAVAFSRNRSEPLYDGPLSVYARPILDLPATEDPPGRSSRDTNGRWSATANGRTASANGRTTTAAAKPSGKGAPYSYLSLVDGVLERHRTWAECEQRVKGRSGARFKKAMSAAEEAEILRGWGVAATRL
jgi:ribonuclease HI